jgi:predicted adenine nucleotide alpha hydrolase (AANH) superfamily ATPase
MDIHHADPAKSRLLLHVCCAPCSTASIERLRDNYVITGFFFNPNIFPVSEYERRLGEAQIFFEQIGLPIIVGAYDAKDWAAKTSEFADEPEGGRRCCICMELRLRVAAASARERGFDLIATVLSISPHKDVRMINELGRAAADAAGIGFLELDLKKGGGFQRSVELSRAHHLYRQDYCGCAASLRERDRRRAGEK